MTHQNPARQASKTKATSVGAPHAQPARASSSPREVLQRAQADPASLSPSDLLQLQRAIGNRATGRLLAQRLSVQTKLQLGPANDKYEQEADAVARQVVRRMAAPPVQRDDKLGEDWQGKSRYDLAAYSRPQPAPAKRGFVAPKVQRDEMDEELAQAKPLAATISTVQRSQGTFAGHPVVNPYAQRDEMDEELAQAKPLTATISTVQRSQGTFAGRPVVNPYVQREELDEDLTQASPTHGLEGGDVDSSVAERIQRASGGGSALDPKTRTGMEGAFGADFGGVRVHTDGQADTLNRSLNARAFTKGKDIFFRKGEYSPGSSGGKELLAHELTHTVQQGAADVQRDGLPADSISQVHEESAQRDIGFEFETNTVMTGKTNRRQALPIGGFPTPVAGTAAWNDPRRTRVEKGKTLLRRNDIEIQGDDRPDGSDLEAVTTHFPLTVPGRTRLQNAMGDLTALVNAYVPLAATGGNVVPAVALNGTANFTSRMRDGLIQGNWGAATTAPQVTIGTRIGNIGDIVRDLHGDPHETVGEKATRDPGRLRFRRPDNVNPNEPRALNALDDASTLVNGYTLARGAIASYQAIVDPTAPGGSELEGLLTIVFTYCEGMRHKQAFLKQHTPLMAKTNLATIFTTLPAPVQTYYSTKDPAGVSNLEKLVAEAPSYDTRMAQPLFAGVGGVAEDDQPLLQPQWYHRLTLESWLRGIVLRDRTKGEAFKQWVKDTWGGSTKRPGQDQLTTKAFPGRPRGQEIEGYGALGRRMDVDEMTGESLPVFELRAPSRPITFAAAQQWALDLFDYVQSLNLNPGGGYNHIV